MSSARPPAQRTRLGLRLTAAAALGRFELQQCTRCDTVQYPPREACHNCLSTRLVWRVQPARGSLISTAVLFHSHHEYFRQRLPWPIGTVRLDCGPIVIAHLHQAVGPAPCPVRVLLRLDRSGQGVMVAAPDTEVVDMSSDARLSEMTCDPAGQHVLLTDGGSATGAAVVRALLGAGAGRVWVGWSGEGRDLALAGIKDLDNVSLLPLDLRNSESVAAAAAVCGDSIDILINNSMLAGPELQQTQADLALLHQAQAHMDANYFGLLRLVEKFGPRMTRRSSPDPRPEHGPRAERGRRPAWVNLLSVDAMSNVPARGTYGASMAAAHSLAQWLRAHMYEHGVRVISAFVGPMEADALAEAIVQGLRAGVEEVHAGDVAQQWLARWLESPKVLERELASDAHRKEAQ